MNIAFDIDDTLYKVVPKKIRGGDCVLGCVDTHHECDNYSFDQVPDYDLIQVLRWFHSNGNNVYVWSGGGQDYAKAIVSKLGLDQYITRVIDKNSAGSSHYNIDITFDDQTVDLGSRANVKVKRI